MARFMKSNDEPSNAREAYKAIIDQFVSKDATGLAERLIRESGIYGKADCHNEFNQFVSLLTQEQREVLARLLHEERIDAIASVLSTLTWWISCCEVAITYRGERMPMELTEEGLYGDFLARCDGWQWLDKSD
jgi:hypothetical protein